jgi:hypothetical protein
MVIFGHTVGVPVNVSRDLQLRWERLEGKVINWTRRSSRWTHGVPCCTMSGEDLCKSRQHLTRESTATVSNQEKGLAQNLLPDGY